MRQAEKKKQKDKVAIALMLCFCVIALTSIFTIKSNIDKIDGSQSGVPVSEKTNTGKSGETQKDKTDAGDQKDSEAASVKVPVVDSQTSGGSGTSDAGFTNPVKAENAYVTNDYSMDSLIYSVTLDQYMVHCGVDIEAPEDTQVLAAADGTVTAIYTDDRYGNSVEITHDNGFITVYSNLTDASMVEVGDTVSAGDIIGGVGTTGLFEALEPAHLHLEMLKDGAYVDPMEYIKLSS